MNIGLFDVLTPILTSVDVWLSAILPVAGRLVFWALISAVISLWIFKLLSNPEKTAAIKVELKATQKELNNHDGEFSELKHLAVKSLALSLKRMRMTFLPALISMLPIIFILVFLSSRFDFQEPIPGEQIDYAINWEQADQTGAVAWVNKMTSVSDEQLFWPSDDSQLVLMVNSKPVGVVVPIPVVPLIHKKQWWNILFANPAGYLADDSLVNSIEFGFKSQKPGDLLSMYFTDWQWPYFIMVFMFSVVLIVVFKIKF